MIYGYTLVLPILRRGIDRRFIPRLNIGALLRRIGAVKAMMPLVRDPF